MQDFAQERITSSKELHRIQIKLPDQVEGRQACEHNHCMSEFGGSLLIDGKTC